MYNIPFETKVSGVLTILETRDIEKLEEFLEDIALGDIVPLWSKTLFSETWIIWCFLNIGWASWNTSFPWWHSWENLHLNAQCWRLWYDKSEEIRKKKVRRELLVTNLSYIISMFCAFLFELWKKILFPSPYPWRVILRAKI